MTGPAQPDPLLVPCYLLRLEGEEVWTARPLWMRGGAGHATERNPRLAVAAFLAALDPQFQRDDGEGTARLTWRPPGLRVQHLVLPPLRSAWRERGRNEVCIATFPFGPDRMVVVPSTDSWLLFEGPSAPSPEAIGQRLDADLQRRRARDRTWSPPPPAFRGERVVFLPWCPPPRSRPFSLGSDDPQPSDEGGGHDLEALTVDSQPPDQEEIDGWWPDPRAKELAVTLGRARPFPIALVGPEGSGRTTLLWQAYQRLRDGCDEALAELIRDSLRGVPPRGSVPAPPVLRYLDTRRITSGMSLVGSWQTQLEGMLRHLERRQAQQQGGPADLLCLDDVVGLATVGPSSDQVMTAATVMAPWLERRVFPVVVEATPQQWDRFVDLARPVAGLFQVLRVTPADEATSREIAARRVHARSTTRRFPLDLPDTLAQIDQRFGGALALPGRMLTGLEELWADQGGLRGGLGARRNARRMTELRGWSRDLQPDRPLSDPELRGRLSERLVGQPDAVDALASAIHAVKSGLRSPRRPIASWLFMGPPGVGKTEAARLLTEQLFGDQDRLVRLDMNTFSDPTAPLRLLGGLGHPGVLTAPVRGRPACVVLLDEIDKAHPLVHDLLLQLLDEGRLTDAEGQTVSFTDAVIVLTSNLGAAALARNRGFGPPGAEAADAARSHRALLEQFFRPELVNRFDRVVVFRPLGGPELMRIARLEVERIAHRPAFQHRRALPDVSDDLLIRLVESSAGQRLGARGLRRAMERELVAGVAEQLASDPSDQPIRVQVRLEDGEARFTAVPLRVVPRRAAVETTGEELGRLRALEARLGELRPEATPLMISSGGAAAREEVNRLNLSELLGELRSAAEEAADRTGDPPTGAERQLGYLRPTVVAPRRPNTASASAKAGGRRERTAWEVERLELASGRSAIPDALGARVAILEAAVEALAAGAPLVAEVGLKVRLGRSLEIRTFVQALHRAYTLLAERTAGHWPSTAFPYGHPHSGFVLAEGVGLVRMLAREQGLTWWRGPQPTVLEVQVRAPGAEAPPPSDRVIREVVFDQGEMKVVDLATGGRCTLEELPEALWAWTAAGCEP